LGGDPCPTKHCTGRGIDAPLMLGVRAYTHTGYEMKTALLGITMLLAIATSSPTTAAQQKSSVPQFEQYPATSVYTGKPAQIILVTEAERTFRTRLRNAAKQSANFAGEYVLTTWGCGTSCITGAVVSLKTGVVTFLPGTICCWYGKGERLHFRLNSRLLVTAGVMNEESEHGVHFYEFTGDEFKHLKTVPVKRVEPQY